MSRKLTVVFLAMLVLVGAMSLKTVVVTHGDGSVIMANGSAPQYRRPHGRMAARHSRRRLGRMAARRSRQRPGSNPLN